MRLHKKHEQAIHNLLSDWKNQGIYVINGLHYLSLGILSENIYRGIFSGPKKGRWMIIKMIKTATTLVRVSTLYVVAMAVFMTLGFTISRPVFDSKSDVCGSDDWL